MKEILEGRISLLRSQLADVEQRREYIQAQLRLLEDIAELIEKYPALGEGLIGLFRQTAMPRRRRTRELVNTIVEVLKAAPQGMELEEIRRALLEDHRTKRMDKTGGRKEGTVASQDPKPYSLINVCAFLARLTSSPVRTE